MELLHFMRFIGVDCRGRLELSQFPLPEFNNISSINTPRLTSNESAWPWGSWSHLKPTISSDWPQSHSIIHCCIARLIIRKAFIFGNRMPWTPLKRAGRSKSWLSSHSLGIWFFVESIHSISFPWQRIRRRWISYIQFHSVTFQDVHTKKKGIQNFNGTGWITEKLPARLTLKEALCLGQNPPKARLCPNL